MGCTSEECNNPDLIRATAIILKFLYTAPNPLVNGDVKSGILEVFILKLRNKGI